MRARRSRGLSRWWLCGVGTAATVLWLAAPAAASHHSSKPKSGPASCISASKLSAAVGASWSGPHVTPGLSPGQKLCNYTQSSSGGTFLVSHEALDGSTIKALAKELVPGTHLRIGVGRGGQGAQGWEPGRHHARAGGGRRCTNFRQQRDGDDRVARDAGQAGHPRDR